MTTAPEGPREVHPSQLLLWHRVEDVAEATACMLRALTGDQDTQHMLFVFPPAIADKRNAVLCLHNFLDKAQLIEFVEDWLTRAKSDPSFLTNAEAAT